MVADVILNGGWCNTKAGKWEAGKHINLQTVFLSLMICRCENAVEEKS
jgi:hypothetical protein